MTYFALRLNTPRPSFPFDMSDVERDAMNRHVAYWTEHCSAGKVIAFGPVMDPKGPWGLMLLEAEDEAEAARLAGADPVILADLGLSYDIMPVPRLILRPNA